MQFCRLHAEPIDDRGIKTHGCPSSKSAQYRGEDTALPSLTVGLVGMTGIGPVLTVYQTVFLPLKDIPLLVPPLGIEPTRTTK